MLIQTIVRPSEAVEVAAGFISEQRVIDASIQTFYYTETTL